MNEATKNETADAVAGQVQRVVMQLREKAKRDDHDGRLMEIAANWIDALNQEVFRLADTRGAESYRLDWLIARLPGSVTRDLLGEISDTSNMSEWRDAIDRAAGIERHNA